MKVVVLGAAGGLGRHAVDAALKAGHDVRAFVRDAARARLPAAVEVVTGDARSVDDVVRATTGRDAALFCVNPPIAQWPVEFPPLLATAIAAVKTTGARLVFPANVWVYGPGKPGDLVDEQRPPSPTSTRGKTRAALEATLRSSGARWCVVRLPEFYGKGTVSVAQRVFAAAQAKARVFWPGSLDVEVELVYMPDGATALVEAGCAPDTDGETFHVPAARTTPRAFAALVYGRCGGPSKVLAAPPWLLRVAGVVDPIARAAADIAHLWTHPILLDGAKYARRFGRVPITPLEEGVAATLA